MKVTEIEGELARVELIDGELTHRIIGVFYEVFRELGTGHLEKVYQRAMQIALNDVGISSRLEVPTTVYFRERRVGGYRSDLIVERRVILECKTADRIVDGHRAQLINYLKSTGGLLLNFGRQPTFERVVFETLRNR